MSNIKKHIILVSISCITFFAAAQEGTRTSKTADISGKIMIIPFEPRLYMSDIDMKINQQTKWKSEKIRENFRHQLDNQLKQKLKSLAPVVSFYTDSAKMAKDLFQIYQSVNLSYELVSNPTPTKSVVKENGIKNGQIVVEANTDKRFMSIKVNDAQLLSSLNKKYKCDYFVFINQLDIVNNTETYSLATDTYMRDVTVHYTILDKTGKYIAAGPATTQFPSTENDPKKIVSQSFAPVATYITAKLQPVINPVNTATNGKK